MDVIAALCEEVDVLVIGTVWRSGPAGVLIGDTAEEALARIDCSVLTGGFVGCCGGDRQRPASAGKSWTVSVVASGVREMTGRPLLFALDQDQRRQTASHHSPAAVPGPYCLFDP